jgi:hypothetical protein
MQFTRSLLFLLLFTGLVAHCFSQKKKQSLFTKKYSPRQVKEDAFVFRDVVLAMHPSVGIYQPREYYVKLLDDFVQSLNDSLTQKEFRLKLKLVADELHCGHTEVLYSPAFYKEIARMKLNFSPFIFIPVQNKVYLLANLNKRQDSLMKKGAEITRINGISVDSMMRYSKRFISSDGFNQSAKEHYLQLGFNSYYVGLFGRPDTFNVEYTDGKSLKTVKYAAFKPKNIPALPLGPKDDSLFTRFKKAGIRYRYLDKDKKTMLMRIERFSHRFDMHAYRKIFRKLRRNKSENLVIDLRNNGGGSLANSYRLLSYLIDTATTQTLRTSIRNYPYRKYTSGNIWFRFTRLAYKIIGKKRTVNDTDNFVYTIRPRKRNHFNGKVYVLINGGSFSASSLVAAYLKYKNRAVFIGEETGGTAEGCNAGITPYYKLPNTGIRVRMPAFRIVHDVSPLITGAGVMPDYRTEYTFRDIITRRDLELLKVKELLKIP